MGLYTAHVAKPTSSLYDISTSKMEIVIWILLLLAAEIIGPGLEEVAGQRSCY
jgi:hypothetical protein